MNAPAFSDVSLCNALAINAPDIFRDPAFVEWLNNGTPKLTCHQGGEPDEWSDIVVFVDPTLNGEGSDSDMPEHIWDLIVEECRKHFKTSMHGMPHIMVKLTNIED